jgi:predicted GNAT family N-acyltransferase
MRIEIVTNEKQLQDAFQIRKSVFVEEQNVPIEEEIDAFDEIEKATHFVVYNDKNSPVGTGRFRKLMDYGKIERICILPEYRNSGVGKQLMEYIIQFAKQVGVVKVKLNAQTHALPFYEKLGFTVNSNEFLDAGIPHKAMEKEI